MKAQEGSRGIEMLFLQPRRQIGMGGQSHGRTVLPREWPGTHCVAGWTGPRAGVDCTEYLAPTAKPTELSIPAHVDNII
jgi:hypothetical protein